MFYTNNNFNQQIRDWDVSNVTNMRDMFQLTTFNQQIRDWDTNVTDMRDVLSIAFNQDIALGT